MPLAATAETSPPPSGVAAVGDLSWGTHFCLFYAGRQELLDALVGYYRAGLFHNDHCLWVTAPPIRPAEAREALRAVVLDLEERERRRQIEILDHGDWYLHHGGLDPHGLIEAWLEREADALHRGYAGLRMSGSTSWLERRDWDAFTQYEAAVHEVFRTRRILALCSYSLERCSASEIVDVVHNHELALIAEQGGCQVATSATAVLATAGLSPEHTGGQQGPVEPHVAFFDETEYRAERIAAPLMAGLRTGEGALVLATHEHRELLVTAMRQRGCDTARAIEREQLVLGDARQISAALLEGGRPSPERFEALIAAPVRKLGSRFGRVHVYGEIVDLLCREHGVEAAVDLEALWNRLLATEPVALACGYRLESFDGEGPLDALERVCRAHVRVLPVETVIVRGENVDVDRLTLELQHKTRVLASETDRRRRLEAERADLLEAERRWRLQAKAAVDQLGHLQRITSALSEAATSSQIAQIVAVEIATVVSAQQIVLAVPVEREAKLRLLGHAGICAKTVAEFGTFAVDTDLPVAAAFRTGVAEWLPSPEAIDERYHHLRGISARAVAALPLDVATERLGAVGFGFAAPRDFSAADRALLEDLARQVAVALDRARLYDDTRRARDRLQLLANVTTTLSQARLSLRQVLDTIVSSATSSIADSCSIHLRSRDHPEILELAARRSVGPEAQEAARSTLAAAPIRLGEGPVGAVAASGNEVFLPVATAEGLARSCPEHYPHLAEYLTGSFLALPLRTSAGIMGALTATRSRRAAPFTDEDLLLFRDIADRAALFIENALLYERAEAERRRAEEANRAKDEFLATLGHELRNPLSPIVTALQLMQLRSGGILEKERTIIARQVRHLARLVDDLLDVSRITQGKIELARRPVELAEVTAIAIEIALPLIEERSHRLEIRVPPTGLVVEADAHRLAQAIANLLTNAAKYTEHGGLIELIAGAEGSWATVTVRDNGIGIEAALLPRVFDSFVQGRRGLDRDQGGLGLGLAIVRTLVEMHGGRATACSEGVGRGSEFRIEVPLATATAPAFAAARDPETDAEPREQRRKVGRILVVDDDRDSAATLSELLAAQGHEVRVAYDGRDALEAAIAFAPEVALLDIGLPVMNGYELARRLRSLPRGGSPKLVAITGYGRESDRAQARAAGFDDHLVKPISLELLEPLVTRLLAD